MYGYPGNKAGISHITVICKQETRLGDFQPTASTDVPKARLGCMNKLCLGPYFDLFS